MPNKFLVWIVGSDYELINSTSTTHPAPEFYESMPMRQSAECISPPIVICMVCAAQP